MIYLVENVGNNGDKNRHIVRADNHEQVIELLFELYKNPFATDNAKITDVTYGPSKIIFV